MTKALGALRSRALRAPVAAYGDSAAASDGGGPEATLRVADNLSEEFVLTPQRVKDVYAVHLLERLDDLDARSAIVFCGTRRGAERFAALLKELRIEAASLHSGLPQRARLASLARVRRGA